MLDKSPIIRVFFGIPIAEDEAQQCRKLLLKTQPQLKNQVRWTRPGNHHITIRFLGNIAEQKVSKLITAVDEAIKEIEPFQLQYWNISLFPPQHGRMVAVNIQPSVELQSLYNAIDFVATSIINFPLENRPYMPHITLFRLKDKQIIKFNKVNLDNKCIEVNEFILYQSVPIEKGSLYVPLHKFSL